MFWLIEDIDKIKEFCDKKYNDVFVEVIPSSTLLHPSQNSISALYVRPFDDNKGYIIPISHSETLNMDIDVLDDILDSITNIYVRNKKEFLHYFYRKNIFSPPPTPNHNVKRSLIYDYFSRLYPTNNSLNEIIPIVKHYEICDEYFHGYDKSYMNDFYNDKAYIVYNMLERPGIKFNHELWNESHDIKQGEYVFTNYNLNTTTVRPSNTFGGINFPSLKKSTDERESFIPRNDIFVEMDISGYHLYIIANLLDYNFDSPDIHVDFAEMYNVDYQRAKEITFQQIYGGVRKEYEHLEFFSKLKTYTNECWEKYITDGYIECPISKHIFRYDSGEETNPPKLLNHIIQNMETSYNTLMLWDIFKILRGKNTKIVLTVFDSFLIDLDVEEKDCIFEIEKVFTKYGFKVKYKKGKTYNFK